MKLFVYGTLKTGCCRNSILSDSKFLKEAKSVKDYLLYDTGYGFPALVESVGKGVAVNGEVWEVDKETMSYLDQIEGVGSGLYARKEINLEDGSSAIAYLWQRSTDNFQPYGDNWTE